MITFHHFFINFSGSLVSSFHCPLAMLFHCYVSAAAGVTLFVMVSDYYSDDDNDEATTTLFRGWSVRAKWRQKTRRHQMNHLPLVYLLFCRPKRRWPFPEAASGASPPAWFPAPGSIIGARTFSYSLCIVISQCSLVLICLLPPVRLLLLLLLLLPQPPLPPRTSPRFLLADSICAIICCGSKGILFICSCLRGSGMGGAGPPRYTAGVGLPA